MNRFLYHTSCERCGSSDAKAIYSHGDSFCFSCRGVNSAKISPYVASSQAPDAEDKPIVLPSDVTQNYPEHAVAWCNGYDITVQQMLQNNMVYSKWKDQLIFTFYGNTGDLLAYQARNLNPVSKGKRYFTCGDVNDLLPIYHCRCSVSGSINARRLVLVEDCLSAIKVSYTEGLGASAMPLLGSGISRQKLSRLRPFYDLLTVFLDGDMYPKAIQIMQQAQLLGFKANVVYSELDPKAHSYKDLTEMLA